MKTIVEIIYRIGIFGTFICHGIVAYLVKFFGKPALLFLQKHLVFASTILGIVIIIFSAYIL